MPNSDQVECVLRKGLIYTKDSQDNWKAAKCHTKSKAKRWTHVGQKKYNPPSIVKRHILGSDGRRIYFMDVKKAMKIINELGGNIKSDSTLRKYSSLGLIPKPTHSGLGKGLGSKSELSNDTPYEFRASQIMRKGPTFKISPNGIAKARKTAIETEKHSDIIDKEERNSFTLKDEDGNEHIIDRGRTVKTVKISVNKEIYDLITGKGSLGTMVFDANKIESIPHSSIEKNLDYIVAAKWLQNKLKAKAGFNPQDENVNLFTIRDGNNKDQYWVYVSKT